MLTGMLFCHGLKKIRHDRIPDRIDTAYISINRGDLRDVQGSFIDRKYKKLHVQRRS